MMDSTFIACSRLWEQGANPTEISRNALKIKKFWAAKKKEQSENDK